jgi:hypothetical protein
VRVRWLPAFVSITVAAGCGRFGFESQGDGDGGAGDVRGDGMSIDAVSTGPTGARWMRRAGRPGTVGGRGGGNAEVAMVEVFNGTFNTDGVALTGMGFSSTAFVRYDALGNIKQALTLDATGFCEMHDAIIDGDDTIVAGLTIGTTSVPSYGACSIATNRQDPVAIRIAPDDSQSVIAHWSASGANAQAWSAAKLSDDSLVMSGIYGANLTVASPLVAAQHDPNGWIARSDPTLPTGARWANGMSATVEVHGGSVSARDDATCAMGAFRGPVTLFGVALPYVGGYDTWVAHIAVDATIHFVRGIGSTGDESSFESASWIAALPDGGCALGIAAPADVTFDSTTMPASMGPGLMLVLGSNGALARWYRFASAPAVAVIGDVIYVAFTVGAPTMVGTALHTPAGTDVIVVALGVGVPDRLVGVVGGDGDQTILDLFGVAPDALGIAVKTDRGLVFGDTAFDTGATSERAVGVLGL